MELFFPLVSVDRKQSKTFISELKKEMSKGHILKKEKFTCIARREKRDDFLFYIKSIDKYAMVHLTWSKETKPDWPFTIIYNSIDELKEKWNVDFG